MDFISILSPKKPPPSGEGNRVTVEGEAYIRARQSVAAIAALSLDSRSVSLWLPPLPEGEDFR